ncbi:hypothetical protein RSOL_142820, partial [Rhizoctonia solani AG-3 Rhs1AP]
MTQSIDNHTLPDDIPVPPQSLKGAKNSRRTMNLGVSEYIATVDCRTGVIDREFNNPPHAPCYEVGGCDRCVERQQHNQEVDRHIGKRNLLKEEAEDRNVEDFEPDEARGHKKPSKRDNERYRYGEFKVRFINALTAWRWKTFMELSELYSITPNHIMTDKELAAIAETKGITDASAFDQIDIQWPGRQEWKVEVLEVLKGAQSKEDEKLAELDQQRQEKEREKERVRLGRAEKLEQKWLEKEVRNQEKEVRNQEKAKEQAWRDARRATGKEESNRKVAERHALTQRRAAEHATSLQQMEVVSGGCFSTFSLTPIQSTPQLTPAHAIGTIQIRPDGSPLQPSPALLNSLTDSTAPNLHLSSSLLVSPTITPGASTSSTQLSQTPGPSTPSQSSQTRVQSSYVFVPYYGLKD